MTYEETFCTLIFDEMKIKQFLEYSKVLDIVEGFEDLGTFGRTSAIASQIMVFMIRELKSPTAAHTAEFVKEINNLFDCLNSQSLYCSNPYKCAISEERQLIQWTRNAILGVYKEQKKIGFHYLLTACFNQDAIEDTFSFLAKRWIFKQPNYKDF
ncbi:hypothetical protein QTP88_029305 [Uroleucon formosanum]